MKQTTELKREIDSNTIIGDSITHFSLWVEQPEED